MPSNLPEALAALVESVVKDIVAKLEPRLRDELQALARNALAEEHRQLARGLEARSATSAVDVPQPRPRLSQRQLIIQVLEARDNKPMKMPLLLRAVAGDGDSNSTRRAIARMKSGTELVETQKGLKLNRNTES